METEYFYYFVKEIAATKLARYLVYSRIDFFTSPDFGGWEFIVHKLERDHFEDVLELVYNSL